jgi:methionyl-tRNA formyltransferase
MFAMCIDVYLPERLIDLPRLGTFLWHEGITPDYRGVYSPFWALSNEDHENLGYTLLRMNHKLDAGDIYLQGKAENIDAFEDWHSYIGHKAVLDSLPSAQILLEAMATDRHQPLARPNAKDAYYSYPTATKLLKIALRRQFAKSFGKGPVN